MDMASGIRQAAGNDDYDTQQARARTTDYDF